jgi:MraZ protein
MADDGADPIIGQYPVTLDEKGRLMFPARLRTNFSDSSVVITRGDKKCLWIFTKAEWFAFSEKLLLTAKDDPVLSLNVQRRHISPAMEVAIDRTWRLAIPQNLRTLSGLAKEGLVGSVTVGKTKALELWDTETYNAWLAADDETVLNALR